MPLKMYTVEILIKQAFLGQIQFYLKNQKLHDIF